MVKKQFQISQYFFQLKILKISVEVWDINKTQTLNETHEWAEPPLWLGFIIRPNGYVVYFDITHEWTDWPGFTSGDSHDRVNSEANLSASEGISKYTTYPLGSYLYPQFSLWHFLCSIHFHVVWKKSWILMTLQNCNTTSHFKTSPVILRLTKQFTTDVY